MSFLNLSGEEADPVKALIFRELRDSSRRGKEEERAQKEEEEIRSQEERREKNRRWRQLREEREKSRTDTEVNWDEEIESNTKKKKMCVLL